MVRPHSLGPACLLAAFLAGCGDDGGRTYRVPKEQPQGPGMAAMSPPPSPSPIQGEGQMGTGAIHWKVPAGWKELPGAGMRLASFTVPGPGGTAADLSVVVLPGDAGGDLANVNRWRGQIGLEPVDEKALAAQSKRVKSSAGTLLVVDIAGAKTRLLAAILDAHGNTWFFKLAGDDAVVSAARSSFLEFLASLHFAHAP